MAKRILIAQDQSGNDQLQFWNENILEGTLIMYDLTFFFSRPINDGGKFSSRQILNNSYEQIHIGDKRYDRAFFIDYVIERGSLYEVGELMVVYKESPVFGISRRTSGDDAAVTLSFTTDGNNIILIATASNTGVNATLKLTTKTIAK
jgi:hypothetical protein